jgi:predicted DNA-binding transcriptional regulator YafY
VARTIKLLRMLEDGLYPIDELETKLAVCARTVYRDMAVLRAAGVRVECRDGLYGIDEEGGAS